MKRVIKRKGELTYITETPEWRIWKPDTNYIYATYVNPNGACFEIWKHTCYKSQLINEPYEKYFETFRLMDFSGRLLEVGSLNLCMRKAEQLSPTYKEEGLMTRNIIFTEGADVNPLIKQLHEEFEKTTKRNKDSNLQREQVN